jgi:hypothetical protein
MPRQSHRLTSPTPPVVSPARFARNVAKKLPFCLDSFREL